MSGLLTIAIPSYNRAAKLDRQLGWLAGDIAGVERLCEVIVSDNASPDDTPAICKTWRRKLESRGVSVQINRNEANIGPLPNIARCIELSTSRFTWVIGDDDEIPHGQIAWIIQRLEADPDLASIVLNFRSVGRTVYDRCFHFDSDQLGDGTPIIAECLRQAYFGLAFMTAQVYRTEYVQQALCDWPRGIRNYDFQVFLTAYTGMQGRVLATAEPHVTYVTGENVYETNKRVGLQLYADSLEVFLNLRRIGYSGRLCRHLARWHLWGLKRRLIEGAMRNNPLLTLKTAARALWYSTRLLAIRS